VYAAVLSPYLLAPLVGCHFARGQHVDIDAVTVPDGRCKRIVTNEHNEGLSDSNT